MLPKRYKVDIVTHIRRYCKYFYMVIFAYVDVFVFGDLLSRRRTFRFA